MKMISVPNPGKKYSTGVRLEAKHCDAGRKERETESLK